VQEERGEDGDGYDEEDAENCSNGGLGAGSEEGEYCATDGSGWMAGIPMVGGVVVLVMVGLGVGAVVLVGFWYSSREAAVTSSSESVLLTSWTGSVMAWYIRSMCIFWWRRRCTPTLCRRSSGPRLRRERLESQEL